jgi:hypothetical protein
MFDASVSTFQLISVSIGSKSYFWRIFDVFSRLLNANNSETDKTNPLKLRLLRGSPRLYELAESELSRFNSKKSIFELSTPTVSRGVEVGRPDHDRSMVLDVGLLCSYGRLEGGRIDHGRL